MYNSSKDGAKYHSESNSLSQRHINAVSRFERTGSGLKKLLCRTPFEKQPRRKGNMFSWIDERGLRKQSYSAFKKDRVLRRATYLTWLAPQSFESLRTIFQQQ